MKNDSIKEIPGYPGFKITSNGVVYAKKGEVVQTRINDGGYVTVSLAGYVRGYVMVHNLVLNAHGCQPPSDGAQYHANHFDGNRLNNEVLNLEWVTIEQNAAHRALFGNLDYRRLVIFISGISQLTSMNEASQILKLSLRDVWNKVKSGEIYYISRREPKTSEHVKPGQFKLGSKLPVGYHNKKKIWIKNIHTGEVNEYESTSAAAKAFVVSPTNINLMISHHGDIVRLFKKQYIICTSEQFPEFDVTALEDDVRLYSQGRPFIAYNFANKQLVVGSSGTAFTKEFNLPRARTLAVFKKNELRVFNGWLLLYDTKENRIRFLEFIKNQSGHRPVFPD